MVAIAIKCIIPVNISAIIKVNSLEVTDRVLFPLGLHLHEYEDVICSKYF